MLRAFSSQDCRNPIKFWIHYFHWIMPRKTMNTETMEFYKRIPRNEYKDVGYHHGESCSNCGHNEYEDMLRDIAICKKKIRNYEKHCPSCHCPPERQRFSSHGRPRTLENVKAMLKRYESISTEPIGSAVKKSQSDTLSQKVYWHDCRANVSRCPKRLLQACHQRRSDKHLSDVVKMKGDAVNSEFTNEDVETCSKYTQPTAPIKSSLKKRNHCREPEGPPDEQEYSDGDSEISIKYSQYIQSGKPHVSNRESRSNRIGGDGEYITEMRDESDVEYRQNKSEHQEVKKLVLERGDFEKPKRDDALMINESDKEIERRRKLEIAKVMKSTKPDVSYRTINKPFVLKESIDKSAREPVLDESTQLAKMDLDTTKNCIIESIDHMLNAMDDTKNDASQQEQTEQETVEKITREFQENGWQLLFNALMIHRDSTDSNKRTVRLECLNHIRQQLDKLYALESTLDNYPPKLQSLSSHNVLCNEEHKKSHQLLERKIVDS